MTRMLITAASLTLVTTMAGASPLHIDMYDGSVFDFSTVAVGSSQQVSSFYFGIGDLGRDEGMNWMSGPYFSLVFGSSDVFFFGDPTCGFVGIGGECSVDVTFAPNAVGSFHSVFEISASFNFTEIHDPDDEIDFEYDDSFRVSFLGTGVSPVPLPPAAAGSLIGLALLGWLGRKRRNRRLTTAQTK